MKIKNYKLLILAIILTIGIFGSENFGFVKNTGNVALGMNFVALLFIFLAVFSWYKSFK